MSTAEIEIKLDRIEKLLKTLVILQVNIVDQIESGAKPEVILANSGFSQKEIGDIVGKSQQAVSQAINKART